MDRKSVDSYQRTLMGGGISTRMSPVKYDSMAQGKKSFIAYADWKETFDTLPDEKAGRLIKHIFAYVNDENPETDDLLIRAVFANIKQTLKRDLVKWEDERGKRAVSGRLGGIESGKARRKQKEANEASALKSKQNEANEAVSVSVSVSDSVNVIQESTACVQSLETQRLQREKEILNLLPADVKNLLGAFLRHGYKVDMKSSVKDAAKDFVDWLNSRKEDLELWATKEGVAAKCDSAFLLRHTQEWGEYSYKKPLKNQKKAWLTWMQRVIKPNWK